MMGETGLWLAAGLAVLMILMLLRRPLGAALRLMTRAAAGLGCLWLFNQVGVLIGVQVGLNLITGLTVGLLGMPGFGLLLLLECI